MADYVILDGEKKQSLLEHSDITRPRSSGSKSFLKSVHGVKGSGISWNVGFAVKYLRFMANRWNTDNNTSRNIYNDKTGNHSEASPVQEILRNYDYYNAQQDNFAYAYLQEGGDGQEIAAPWTAGHEIYQTVQHLVGPVRNHLASVKMTVESLDPSVQSIKQNRIAMIEAKKKLPKLFKEFESMGVGFMPEGTETDMDAALQEATRKPAHKLEKFSLDLLNDINNKNNSADFFSKRYMDAIIGRYCGVHLESHQGRIAFDPINPERLIWDKGNEDDDYNRYSLYKGFVSWKSREEATAAYGLGEDAEKILDGMFSTEGTSTLANHVQESLSGGSNGGFSWVDQGDVHRVACVTGYFVATITDRGGETYNTVYKGTLIGDNILADFGEADNIVYDDAHPEWPLMPIWIYSPDTVRGRNVCVVDRFRQMQDDCDAYLHKIRQKISKDLGKTYIVYAEDLGGDAASVSAMTKDLKNFGITVKNRANGEEPISSSKSVEVLDFTLDPNLKTYVELRKEMMQEMQDVVSQSRITRGMQQTYIGGGTQNQTIAQASNGTVMLMQGFFQWYSMFEEYTMNVCKVMLLAAENREEAELVLSESSLDFWESIKDVSMADMQVRVHLEDIIDDEDRKEYEGIALAALQNVKDTGFGFLDYLEVKKARTVTELKRKLKESFELNKIRQDKIRAEEQQLQMAMQQQSLAAAAESEQRKDQSSAQREVIRQTPKMEENQIKREELNLDRAMSMGSDAGMPGTGTS
jgi:hypothetical protein